MSSTGSVATASAAAVSMRRQIASVTRFLRRTIAISPSRDGEQYTSDGCLGIGGMLDGGLPPLLRRSNRPVSDAHSPRLFWPRQIRE